MRLFCLCLAFLLLSVQGALAGVFNAQTFTLANGMQVVVIPNHRAPVVTHMVWYKVGAADEPAGTTGHAHFLEHLMFKGTPSVPPGGFSKIVRTLGGNDNAFTSQDYTAFFESIAVQNLPKMMAMEADRMVNLNPPPAEFASEHKVVMEERRQRTDNDPREAFGEQMRASLYGGHPYGTPTIGWMDEMKKMTWETAKAYYDKWYAPNNAILIVSGDITADELKPLAEKTYGLLKPKEIPQRVRPPLEKRNGPNRVVYRNDAIHQPVFERMYIVPSFHTNKTESLALQVLEEIMGGGPTTRIYKSLVIEKKLATGAGFSYNSYAWDDTDLAIYGTPAPGVAMEDLEKAFDEDLRKLVKDGVTAQELAEAKDRLKAQAIYARDSLTGPAMTFGQELVTGSTVDDIENWPGQIESVTAEQIKAVAAKYLDPDHADAVISVTGYMMPKEQARAPVQTQDQKKQEQKK